MKKSTHAGEELQLLPPSSGAPLALPDVLVPSATRTLERMFRDPRVIEPHERQDLVAHLRRAVELAPQVPEVRVLLGMALSVDLQVHDAMEELRTAVNQAPDCFIARLKFGELLMRLRICDQAAEHTHRAAQLAVNAPQSELARRQATQIRTMMREGIERGGYVGFWSRLVRFGRRSAPAAAPALIASK